MLMTGIHCLLKKLLGVGENISLMLFYMKILQNQKLYDSMCDLAHNWIANHTHSYDKVVNTCHKNVSNQAPNYETNGDFRIKMKNCHIYLFVFYLFILFLF